ncbi:WbqC family protein [Pseudomonas migulae]|uniref:WbqC family protein n=1 Tax=Pseudomonas migulae TaxID=78543 RepID=UPI00372396B9
MKKVAILQSNYIPWKGYFDLIAAVDEFILYDDMQYTRRDWRNRNQIKTPQGLKWLTVPVEVKGKYYQAIRETQIAGDKWAAEHIKAIALNYSKAPFFDEVMEWLNPLYSHNVPGDLSSLNRILITAVCKYLEIETKISCSSDYKLLDGKTERLVGLCAQAGASEYISGPSAKDYIEPVFFSDANVTLTWFDYSGYPEYPQLWGGFEHGVTILDLLMNCGRSANKSMRFVK